MDVSEAYQKLQELDVSDLKRIGTAPQPVRMGALVLLAVAILLGMGWFLVKPAMADLEDAQQEEKELRDKFKTMQSKAAQLEAYEEQKKKLEESLAGKLDQLPTETELEDLLVDLSQTSIAAGLTVNYFEPGSERKQEFYAEYPIDLRVSGKYHEFGKFVSGLASLSRIVTLHDISVETAEGGNGNAGGPPRGSPDLRMTLTAKTYRYLGDSGGSDSDGGGGGSD